MKYSLKYRIIYSMSIGIFLFVLECVLYKLIGNNPEWLSISLLWSIPWAIGVFVSKTLANHIKSLRKVICIEIAIVFVLLILLLFVLGVVFEVAEIIKFIYFIIMSFSMALLINNDW